MGSNPRAVTGLRVLRTGQRALLPALPGAHGVACLLLLIISVYLQLELGPERQLPRLASRQARRTRILGKSSTTGIVPLWSFLVRRTANRLRELHQALQILHNLPLDLVTFSLLAQSRNPSISRRFPILSCFTGSFESHPLKAIT